MVRPPPSSPEPLGVTLREGGANVAVVSAHGSRVTLCLFDERDRETARIPLPERTGDVHHGFVPGIAAGQRYGLRVEGPWAPAEGHRFNPSKLLVDPWATRLDRPFRLDDLLFDRRETGATEDERDSAPAVPKALVGAPVHRPAAVRPALHWEGLVVYELHVRGFTKLHPAVPPEARGTFSGLAHPDVIEHLVRLGVTAVEIMPANAWIDERHLPPLGLANYWGYNPLAYLAPDPRLAPGGWDEVRGAVAALQAAGIAVLVDVVLNHTGESDRWGPTVSFRGLDNATWYRLDPADPAAYVNDAGCGNVLALDRPTVIRLAMDSLRQWALRAGVDGFRYDLAATLGRCAHGFDPEAPLFAAIGQDPVLRDLVHIAEPWDIGPGGHRLGAFPAGWGEWNDRFRDTVRRFWRGDAGRIGDMATRFAGSADIFGPRHRPVSRSLNFVTAHDGFTLADLVAFTSKRNHGNGEENRDGTDENYAWNNGAEGPSDDPAVRAARGADVRALLATLFLSRGTPMISMGDELGRSQGGNNNAYAQDNPVSWLDWASADHDLAATVAALVRLRRETPALTDERPLTGGPLDGSGIPDVDWLTPSGTSMRPADWHDPENRTLIAALHRPATDEEPASRAVVVLHAGRTPTSVRLPQPGDGRGWRRAFDSARPETRGTEAGAAADMTAEVAPVQARSVVAFVEEAARGAGGGRGPADPAALDRLATAGGLALDWWDIDGNNHRVPDDTKRALLAALRLPAGTSGEARDSLRALAEDRDLRLLPHATLAREGVAPRLRLGPGLAGRAVDLVVGLEDGEQRLVRIRPGEGAEGTTTAADGRPTRVRTVDLPVLPAGRHSIHLADSPGMAGHVTVAPATCWLPQDLAEGRRLFGVAAHLYTLRRAGDQGIGDFTTLARLAREAGRAGAAVAGLNPMHALFDQDRSRTSPYSPSDRRFLDPIYIDVADLPRGAMGPAVEHALAVEDPVLRALSAGRAVDYPTVWAAKKRVLSHAFMIFETVSAERGRVDGESPPLPLAFEAFVARGGEALRRFALYETIAELRRETDWRRWPAELAHPAAPGIADVATRHATRVRFSMFLQFLADRQLGDAARAARDGGLRLGFYRDLAVGCAPDGAEAWSEQDRLAQGVSVGAPPDPFSAAGQVWNLPAPDPRAMARDGFRGFGAMLAANMAHAGALRIDHVLGLKRLFLVPDGATGAEGAYVAMPFDDLVGQVALESRRAETLVVGEDLGTVPEGFRERLDEAGLLSYRVLWFERRQDGFVPPERYPRKAAACVSTHDLATLAGWWGGADIDEDVQLGRLDADGAVRAREARTRDRTVLVGALAAEGLIEPEAASRADFGPELAAAVHAFVARTPSLLALVQADDLAGETEAVNLPGTDRERSNWSRRLEPDVTSLFDGPLARAILGAMRGRSAAS
ncbi:glycogen debranching protein GlgX [Prosthecomicrobium sp. N25]|uniref:glycogen debranching protein GlgX n=1 Tax=Prosthecomicrobium sp. N25 TaxID=3129254 RepID=UPI003077FD3F